MLEEAVVKKAEGITAEVVVTKEAEKCGSCKICSSLGSGKLSLNAENSVGAKVGDRVIVLIEKFSFFKMLPIYIFPLFFMVGGYFVLPALLGIDGPAREGAGIIGSFAFLILYFLVIYFIFKLINKVNGERYSAKIIEIKKSD